MQCEQAVFREQLLQGFMPDDLCSLGGQYFNDTTGNAHHNNKKLDKVNNGYQIHGCSLDLDI